MSFKNSNTNSGPNITDPFATLSQLAALQQQLDETKIIARSDTLQAGEPIAEAGTLFDAAGRRWMTVNPNACLLYTSPSPRDRG